MPQRGPKTNNVSLLYLVCLRSVADGLCVLKYRYTLLLIFPRINNTFIRIPLWSPGNVTIVSHIVSLVVRLNITTLHTKVK